MATYPLNVIKIGLALLTLAVIAAARAPAAPRPDEGEVVFERWYALSLQGQRMGWMHENVRRNGDRITTFTDMKVSLSRGIASVSVDMSTMFTETADGQPIEATQIQSLGAARTVKTMRFEEDGIELISGQGAQRLSRKVAHPQGSWKTPAAAGRYLEEQTAKGNKQISVRRMDPSMGTTVVVENWQYQGEEHVEVMGKVVPATHWQVTVSVMPGMVTDSYLDGEGHIVRTTLTALPGMPIEIVQADEQLAKAQVDPPELLLSTLVKPDRPIAGPRRLRSAIYELRFSKAGGAAGFSPELPRGGSQRVIWGDDSPAAANTVSKLIEPKVM